MCLTVQPEVINEIGENRQFRGKGLLARFLYSLCKSQVGYRARKDNEVKAIPDNISAQYWKHIFSLMDVSQDSTILTLSPEAEKTWTEFYNDIERDMRSGGSLAHLHDWGSKLPGAVARIAGALHFAKHGSQACQIPISVTSVTASCVIGSYYRDHACATFGYMGEDRRIESARKNSITS